MAIKFEELREQVETMMQTYRTNPDLIAELLQFKSQFYRYSLRNTMAIKSQNPHSTFVDSFQGWRKRGYSVLRGEKGLSIWVPVIRNTFFRSDNEPSVSVAKATTTEMQKIKRGEISVKENLTFRIGKVFDIAQTTCPPEDYPKVYSMGYPDMEHKNLYEQLRKFAQKSGFDVRLDNVQSISLGGYYSPATDEIVLSDKLNDTRRLSVLCHELSHGLMHKNATQPKAVVEFEAEGLAIMLLTRMGLPISDQNKQYASSYYRNIDLEQYDIDQSFVRMQKAYNSVVQGFEQELSVLLSEKSISPVEQPAQPAEPASSRGQKYTPEQVKQWKHQQKDELEQLKRDIQILDYAKDNGYSPKKIGNRYYELAEHGSMRIDPVRNCFFYNAGGNRGSIIDFIQFVHPGMDNKEAIHALHEYAGKPTRRYTPRAAVPDKQEPRPFSLPERLAGKYSRLYAYLTKTRAIDFGVVTHLVKRKMLYEDNRHNCVFAGYDREGVPHYAGLRTTMTEGNFKGEVSGSNKDTGWYVRNGSQSLFVCEAPIDAMSIMSLFKMNNMDYKKFDYVSLAGIAPNALINALKENPDYKRIYLALDNDTAGKEGMKSIKEKLKELYFAGKIIDKVPSFGKDWNQELCHISNTRKQERKMLKNLEAVMER